MSKQADICLILEGSYPFVAGGVSTWVHNLVRGLPDLTFTALCILPSASEQPELKYELPENFLQPEVLYIHDVMKSAPNPFKRLSRQRMKEIEDLHEAIMGQAHGIEHEPFTKIVQAFQQGKYPTWDLIHSKRAWDFFVKIMGQQSPDAPFMDYFWTFRFTHLPLFKALSANIPDAKVYHTVSTGYAGFIGAMARVLKKRPLLLTEHGIYTKERKIEIAQSEALREAGDQRLRLEKDLGMHQQFWIKIFSHLGVMTYKYAERIITLYEGNRLVQMKDGAAAGRTEIIPNGINLDRFGSLLSQAAPREENAEYLVGFVGRVVPIKDVKTFIRACKSVSLTVENVRFLIMGPTDEDEEYYAECEDLVRAMDLEGQVEFLGRVDVTKYYAKLNVIVLTSISEAQPLVIMEANCVGIPVVSSDVGACRELLEGGRVEDRRLGASGVITGIADPADTAKAIMHILQNPDVAKQMGEAGKERISRFYNEADLNQRYRELYQDMIELEDSDGMDGVQAKRERMFDPYDALSRTIDVDAIVRSAEMITRETTGVDPETRASADSPLYVYPASHDKKTAPVSETSAVSTGGGSAVERVTKKVQGKMEETLEKVSKESASVYGGRENEGGDSPDLPDSSQGNEEQK